MENKKEKIKQENRAKEPEAEKKAEIVEAEKSEKKDSKEKTEGVKDKIEHKEKKSKMTKKTEAVVRGLNVPISTKTSYAICRFINGKEIEMAIKELGEIIAHKQALPMKGEIPHRRGNIMSGRYPENASSHFIKLLQSLNANAAVNGIENPVITEAIAGFASRPFGRFGRTRKKRTYIKIIAKSMAIKNREKKEEKK